MARKTHKQMTGKQKEDNLVEKLLIEFGLEQPKQNKKYKNNKKGKGDR